ncbi:MAG: hypothetical protein GX425_01115 [Peptococcaceae bacterium]|nr:hypothetical protein [Peptococcaceae bacterium]
MKKSNKILPILMTLAFLILCFVLPVSAGVNEGMVESSRISNSTGVDSKFLTSQSSGGLVVQNMVSGQQLAEALVGSGVTISNVSYTGTASSAGTFAGGTGIIGFESGVILSTGNISNVVGPNQEPGAGDDNNLPGDTELNGLIPGYETQDATILEFDFVPVSNAIRIQYVFASDEYNEYVGSDYNDVFGFFVNGQNIALVPESNDRVSVNNINLGKNAQYYRNNENGSINTEMDGLTTVLTARATVTPNQTNRIKLAIADAGDGILDSVIMIKASSFMAEQPGQFSFSSGGYSLDENGGTVTITVNRINGSDGTVAVNYASSDGTATAGVDYTAASGTLTFNEGETSKTFTVNIIDDNIVEGNETINLTLSNPTGGATLGVQSNSVITIMDNEAAQPNPTVSLSLNASSVPVNTNVTATAVAEGISDPVYQFWVKESADETWTYSGDFTSSNTYTFTRDVPGSYMVYAYAKSANAPSSTSVQSNAAYVVFTTTGSGVSNLVVTGPNGRQDVGVNATFTATATNVGGTTLYQFWVHDQNGWTCVQDYSTVNTYTLYNLQPGSYVVAVYALDSNDVAARNWHKAYYRVFILNVGSMVSISAPSNVTAGQSVNVSATATGLTGAEYQFWYQNPSGTWILGQGYSNNNMFSFVSSETGAYKVIVYAKDHYAPNTDQFSVFDIATVNCQ